MELALEAHPLLDVAALLTTFAAPPTRNEALFSLLRLDAPVPAGLKADDTVRAAVRDVLRQGGYKPTGRGKPASEYLVRAVTEGSLSSINAAVDACNVVSLHSGLPISVVDADLLQPPLHVAIAPAGASYVFNASGQAIDLAGLVCLGDVAGPCANPVKDSQRTKTHGATRRTLSVIWGATALAGRTALAVTWYRELLEVAGGTTEVVSLTSR
jgi:DNA/RNA-binding domain of Phe-tRNA-synthetase-like protein